MTSAVLASYQSKLNEAGLSRYQLESVTRVEEQPRVTKGKTRQIKVYWLQIKDTTRNLTLEKDWPNFFRAVQKNPDYQFKVEIPPVSRYQELLDEVAPSRFQIRSQDSNGFRIQDNTNSIEFVYKNINKAIEYLRANPAHEFKREETLTEKYQRKVNELAPGRFLLLGIEQIVTRIKGQAQKNNQDPEFLVQNTDGSTFTCFSGSLLAALRADPNHEFQIDSVVTRYQRKLEAIGQGDRFKVLSLVETRRTEDTDQPYHVCLFEDTKGNYRFTYVAEGAIRLIKGNPWHKFKRDESVVEKYQRKIDAIVPGQYMVLSSVDGSSTAPSGAVTTSSVIRVKDIARNNEFEYDATKVVSLLSKDPTRVFFPSMEEKSKRYKEAFIKAGITTIIGGIPIDQFATKVGFSNTYVRATVQALGVDKAKEYLEHHEKHKTIIERIVSSLLVDEEVIFDRKLEGTSYRPDFYLPEHKLAIECDGLYWHSETCRPRNYHVEKMRAYESVGVTVLFFRENEILSKPDIVRSIIANAIGKCSRVFARKTKIVEIEAGFSKKTT